MKKTKRPNAVRQRRVWRVSNKVRRYASRPRLAIFRSNKHIYAQLIDDVEGKTLAFAGSLDPELRASFSAGGPSGSNVEGAKAVGALIAKRAIEAGVKQAAFDRRGHLYHGRVAALADAARDAGLDLGAKAEIVEKKPAKTAKGGKSEKAPKAKKEKK